MTYPLSGNTNIDAILITNGYGGALNTSPGTAVTIYYTFAAHSDTVFGQPIGLQTMNASQQATVRNVIAEYEAVAGLNFVEGPSPDGSYNIGFYIGPEGNGGSFSYYPTTLADGSDLGDYLESGLFVGGWLEVHSNQLGNFEFLVRHELGHGLGLDHPAQYVGDESAPHLDSNAITNFSVMGYGDDTSITLSATDIAALQYLYGAPGGSSGGSSNSGEESLTEGNDTFTITAESVLTLGLAGNDFITGSDGNNNVNGNSGNDTLWGFAGDDSLFGGKDEDNINGNLGNDVVNGNNGNDFVMGGKGSDTVHGGKDDDLVNGNNDNDIVSGDLGNDTVHGGKNDDQLFGNAGNDVLSGDLGNDTMTGGDGSDTFSFQANHGVDQITDFNTAQDFIQLSGTGLNSFSDVQAALTQFTEDGVTSTALNLGDLNLDVAIPTGNGVQIIGVSIAELNSSHFIFI